MPMAKAAGADGAGAASYLPPATLALGLRAIWRLDTPAECEIDDPIIGPILVVASLRVRRIDVDGRSNLNDCPVRVTRENGFRR